MTMEMAGHGSSDAIWMCERITTLHRKALDRFLAGIERRAFRMAKIATGDADEAMDLVQDAMLKLVQRYSTRDEAEWGPLFHTILQHRIRDWYRRTKVRNRWRQWLGKREEPNAQSDFLESVPDTSQPSSDKQLALKQATVALEQALRTLPFRQQQVFLLRAWEELDVAQTATAMGCSQGSVKTHYFRAVHTLRKLLGDHWS
ncbi:MAG: RNA polymerase sigma factor [Nitrospiraceae bacterium]